MNSLRLFFALGILEFETQPGQRLQLVPSTRP